MSKPIIPVAPVGVWTVVALWSCHIPRLSHPSISDYNG